MAAPDPDDAYLAFAQEQLKSGRTLNNILLKFVAVHLATTVAYGHLGSLRNQPTAVHTRTVLAFLLIPTYPMAELLADVYRAFQWSRPYGGRSPSWQY